MEAVDIMREIDAQVAINAGSVEVETTVDTEEKLAAMAEINVDLEAEIKAELEAEASLEGKTKENFAAEIADILEDGTVEASPAVEEGGDDIIAKLVKGYRGANGPELMRPMFLHLIDVKPGTVKELRMEMCEVAKQKSVPARFLKKGLDKLVECGLVEWGGDMKGAVTWL